MFMMALWNSLPQDIVETEALSRSEEDLDKFWEDLPFVAIKHRSMDGISYPESP